jgi:hypothetical protein
VALFSSCGKSDEAKGEELRGMSKEPLFGGKMSGKSSWMAAWEKLTHCQKDKQDQ